LVEVIDRNGSYFQAVVVACRHPTSFFGSLGKPIQSNASLENRKGSWHGPSELLSTIWWNQMMKLSLCPEARPILIEDADADTFSLSKSDLGDKQQLEIVASRAALLVGPRLFDTVARGLHSTEGHFLGAVERKGGDR
jgi:hypothetical protein